MTVSHRPDTVEPLRYGVHFVVGPELNNGTPVRPGPTGLEGSKNLLVFRPIKHTVDIYKLLPLLKFKFLVNPVVKPLLVSFVLSGLRRVSSTSGVEKRDVQRGPNGGQGDMRPVWSIEDPGEYVIKSWDPRVSLVTPLDLLFFSL